MKPCLLAVVLAGVSAGTVADDPSERAWLNYTLPRPHEIAIRQERILAPREIGFRLPPTAGPVERTAARAFERFFADATGSSPAGRTFEILAGVLDPNGAVCGVKVADAARLEQAPNCDQAYLVRPVGDDTLVVAARRPEGVYFGLQTIRQLLSRRIGTDAVLVPLAVITDWPDFEQRGFWNVGHATPGFIPWLATMKLNFCCWSVPIVFPEDGRAVCPPLPMELIRQARDHAFLLMPHAPHYDYWWIQDGAAVLAGLAGKGDGARNPCYRWGGNFAKARNPCMATPLVERLATGWIEGAAEQGVREFSLWLSEHTAQCECPACLKDGRRQMQNETRASIAAIRAAQRRFPDLRGRIFFTLTTQYGSTLEDCRECLAMLPRDIRAERVYARNDAFDSFAAAGKWLASYNAPPLGPGYFTVRYTADATRDSAREYAGARYSALYPRGRTRSEEASNAWEQVFCNYQYSALAEWTWNINGRDVRQFAEAWATLNHVNPADRFADWIEAVRPVVNFARYWEDRPTSDWLVAGKPPPGIAAHRIWHTRLPGPDKVQPLLARCAEAIILADQVAEPSVRLEARYLRTFLQTIEHIHRLCRPRAGLGDASEDRARKSRAIGTLRATIEELGRRRQDLANIPADGPKQIMKRHQAWARELDGILGP